MAKTSKAKEYFVVANSFAAPFFSDTDEKFVKGKDPKDALGKFVKGYKHPAGLYCAILFKNADAYHKNGKALCKYWCNLLIEKEKATKGLGSYSYYGKSQSEFEINGKPYNVENPRGGRILDE